MTAPAGWYPDPGGQPDLYRYFDGETWSTATSANPASLPPGAPSPSPYATPIPSGRRPVAAWLVAVAALLVVMVIVGAIAVRSSGTDKPVTTVTPGSTANSTCPDAALPSPDPAPQTGNRVTSGKLSYPRLGSPFREPQWDRRVPFGRDVQSQDATVETSADGAVTWVAGVMIARLLAGDGFFGPEQGARVIAECVVARFYGDLAVRRTDRRDQAITVDGHRAWTIESHLSFQLANIKTTGETMILVVVDTADGEGWLFYASVPDTSPQFLKPARDALAGLRVA